MYIYTKASSWSGIRNILRSRKNKYVRGKIMSVCKRWIDVEWEYDGHNLSRCLCRHKVSPFDEGAVKNLQSRHKRLTLTYL